MERFLNAIFGDAICKDRRLAIFTLSDRKARLFGDCQSAANYADTQAAGQDVYFGVGLLAGQPQARGRHDDVCGIGALWADIDLAGPLHSNKRLPETTEDIDWLLKQLPLEPSITVHTGHGVHVYWLFDEPWLFDSMTERTKAAVLCREWAALIQRHADERGWAIDNTSDLTRLMRLPATLNHKDADLPIPVAVLEQHTERRYHRAEFAAHTTAVSRTTGVAPVASVAPVSDAEPPAEKFAEAMTESPLFRSTWNHERDDLADQSQSSFDMSLATIAALREWSDAEIASLIAANRRKFGANPRKAMRADYVGRTISRGRDMAREMPDTSDVNLTGIVATDTPSAPAVPGFEVIESPALHDGDYAMEYLVDGLLVGGQPGVLAGPKKTLKTNIGIDLAMSLSEGGLFLGRFNVPRAVRTALMSGESGAATIQETARRIAVAKGRTLDQYTNMLWSFDLPQLGDGRHTVALERLIEDYKLEVLILDPTYLMMMGLGDRAGNLFIVGEFLKTLTELIQRTGCTILMCHHLRKSLTDPYEPAELEHMAWAGFQEFMRQWLLLNRRVKYDADRGGYHELWLSAGGSAGHSGLWGLDIEEHTRQHNGGRIWEVDALTASETYEQRARTEEAAFSSQKQMKEDARYTRRRDAVVTALQQFAGGETKRVLRETAGVSGTVIRQILEDLLEEDVVEECQVQKHTRCEAGYRLCDGGDVANSTGTLVA